MNLIQVLINIIKINLFKILYIIFFVNDGNNLNLIFKKFFKINNHCQTYIKYLNFETASSGRQVLKAFLFFRKI